MDNLIDRDRKKLQAVQGHWSAFSARRLALWAIRWATGIAIMGTVVFFNPEWSWLYQAGASLAALTLVTAMVSQWIIRAKVRGAEKALAEPEKALREAGGD